MARGVDRYEAVLRDNAWGGLPELCGENGSHCPDGCPTQAWSSGCLLDVLHDLADAAPPSGAP